MANGIFGIAASRSESSCSVSRLICVFLETRRRISSVPMVYRLPGSDPGKVRNTSFRAQLTHAQGGISPIEWTFAPASQPSCGVSHLIRGL